MNLDSTFYDAIEEIQLQDEQITKDKNSFLLTKFLEEFKQFKPGEVIFDYPDWLERLRRQAKILSSRHEGKTLVKVADKVTSLIEEISYGAIEDENVKEAQQILSLIRKE